MIIENITSREFEIVDENLIKFNSKQCNLNEDEVFEGIYKCIKSKGEIVGGISGYVELKCALHISILWIHQDFRGEKWGNELLKSLEEEGMQKGAKFSYLETFDFQAKEFYEKNGYKVFADLGYATGNTIYFMKKEL